MWQKKKLIFFRAKHFPLEKTIYEWPGVLRQYDIFIKLVPPPSATLPQQIPRLSLTLYYTVSLRGQYGNMFNKKAISKGI